MTQLYNKAGENFYSHAGQILNALEEDLLTLYDDPKHYDIRSFHTDSRLVPWSDLDDRFWENVRYDDLIISPRDFRSLDAISLRPIFMSELDALQMGAGSPTLDDEQMFELEHWSSAGGQEGWPDSDPDVVVGKDPALNYASTITIALATPGAEKIADSYFEDDLLTDFEDDDYSVQIGLLDFPPQTDPVFLDLENSFIDFSTDSGFSDVASLTFEDSVTDITIGGNVTARWPRSSLDAIDLSAVKAIRFRLKSDGVGSMDFKAQQMRLVRTDSPLLRDFVIDTKRDIFRTNFYQGDDPYDGVYLGSSPMPIFFDRTRPLNSSVVMKFNTGHLAHDPETSSVHIYLRSRLHDPDLTWPTTDRDEIRVRLLFNDVESVLEIKEWYDGVDILSTSDSGDPLDPETDYYFVVTLENDTLTTGIYATNTDDGLQLGELVFDTFATATHLERGYTGFRLDAYGPFETAIDFIAANEVQFGFFESKSFESVAPVVGASLFTSTSPAVNLLEDVDFEAWGDVTVDFLTPYTQVARLGGYQGGVRSTVPLFVGDTSQVKISGEIFPLNEVNGTYRVVLVDRNDQTAYIGDIEGLLPNQWNAFELQIVDTLLPNSYYFHIQQQGNFTDTFRVRSLTMAHNTISWEGSNDDGTTYQRFFDTINRDWGAIHFESPDHLIRVKATAVADTSWIQGYSLVPRYLPPGN
jgi:hypothetical protein